MTSRQRRVPHRYTIRSAIGVITLIASAAGAASVPIAWLTSQASAKALTEERLGLVREDIAEHAASLNTLEAEDELLRSAMSAKEAQLLAEINRRHIEVLGELRKLSDLTSEILGRLKESDSRRTK